jgi:hypothetical protein
MVMPMSIRLVDINKFDVQSGYSLSKIVANCQRWLLISKLDLVGSVMVGKGTQCHG